MVPFLSRNLNPVSIELSDNFPYTGVNNFVRKINFQCTYSWEEQNNERVGSPPKIDLEKMK
jgi:hypothetical protein